jgi:hypothetical protein
MLLKYLIKDILILLICLTSLFNGTHQYNEIIYLQNREKS